MVSLAQFRGEVEEKLKVQYTVNHIRGKYKCSHPMYP